jgi:hypothetical protein
VELAPTSESFAHPWRKATVIVGAIAAVELVLLVAAGIALLGRHLAHGTAASVPAAHHAAAAKPKRARPAPARPEPIGKPTLARSATSVVVLNGNGRSGAAATEASVVSARGYRIGRVGNAPTSGLARTVVMYRPGYRPEAARLAHDIGVTLFAPLDGLTPASLGHAQLAVLVGAE